jgi:uncharacterized membrane protein
MVARSLEKGDLGFSLSSSEVVSFFLAPKAKGRELLRFSALVSFLVSPFTAAGVSVASVAAAAGAATSADRGSEVSTAGITGAVSATASVAGASLVAEASAGAAAGFFLPNERLPKMLWNG